MLFPQYNFPFPFSRSSCETEQRTRFGFRIDPRPARPDPNCPFSSLLIKRKRMTKNNEGCREYVEIIFFYRLCHLHHLSFRNVTRTLRDHSYVIQLTSAYWLTHRYLPELLDSSAMASIGTHSVTSLNLAFARVECTPV